MLPPNKKIWYGKSTDPFHIEFSNRTGHFTMNRYHIHHHYEILYLFSGVRVFFIKDQSYTIRQGDLVIIHSNEIHKSFDIGVPDSERVVAYYDAHYFESFERKDQELLLTPLRGHSILHLAAVSKEFYISPGYLSKVFKEATGFMFTEYVNIVRVKEAQRLLRETDNKIIDISAAVGFGNVSHFGKVFKHVASVSPRDFRKYYR